MLNELPITSLKGVGPRTQELLTRLHIEHIQDLLFHLPNRYEDRTRVTPIGSLRDGDRVLIEGKIKLTQILYGRRRSLLCRLSDGTGDILLRFFHFTASQQAQLTAPGLLLRCYGTVRFNYRFGIEMIHPEYRRVEPGQPLILEDRLTPIYPTTKGLQQNTLRKLIWQALSIVDRSPAEMQELLPDNFIQRFQLPTLVDALHYLHQPPKNTRLLDLQKAEHPAHRRLIIEELLAQQLGVRQFRAKIKAHSAPILQPGSLNFQQTLCHHLPFALTNAQNRVIDEINRDLAQPNPMLRLVQGDVGSGKTIVAAMAIANVVECGYQAALMAPTEILAEQHRHNMEKWFSPLKIKIAWLLGSLSAHEKSENLRAIATGECAIAIGTHALFQNEVEFQKLALVVIDEQHRFGVHQRLALKSKGLNQGWQPHQLIMTATPIPRTLAMTAYADLDVSIIDELPPGRKPIKTSIISRHRRSEIVKRIQDNGQRGYQAYWVCTLIEESEERQCEAAVAVFLELQKQLSTLRVGLIHGRLSKVEKEETMLAFKQGKVDLLVATTVIEVGVDVPNANLMVIENAERLGLAQIHQLRGRVGRGASESFCVLLYQPPLSELAKQRLQILRETQDGFVVAQKDLRLRGPGELLGTRQAGVAELRVADLIRDEALLPEVTRAAELIIRQYPERVQGLLGRWVRHQEQYASV